MKFDFKLPQATDRSPQAQSQNRLFGDAMGHVMRQTRATKLGDQRQPPCSSPATAAEADLEREKNLSLVAQTILADLDSWQRSGQWLFSAYGHCKGAASIAGFEDYSFEEDRISATEAARRGTVPVYKEGLLQRQQSRLAAIEKLKATSPQEIVYETQQPEAPSTSTTAPHPKLFSFTTKLVEKSEPLQIRRENGAQAFLLRIKDKLYSTVAELAVRDCELYRSGVAFSDGTLPPLLPPPRECC